MIEVQKADTVRVLLGLLSEYNMIFSELRIIIIENIVSVFSDTCTKIHI